MQLYRATLPCNFTVQLLNRLDHHCYLGCPVWACESWNGTLYSSRKRDVWLDEYSQVFQTVEGNSTFYGLPTAETVERWARQSNPGFRFCLKFPKEITHDRQLRNCQQVTNPFLELLAILHEHSRLGPTFIQLPPYFSPRQLPALQAYLEHLPRNLAWAVEVRHPDFFEDERATRDLNQMLRSLRVDRVIFDSRPLFSAPPSDEIESLSQQRKPHLPVHSHVTGSHPMLRFVGRNQIEMTTRWIDEWCPTIATWIAQGLQPFIFTHAPNDHFAPALARLFYRRLAHFTSDLTPLPTPWPGENALPPQQLRLF